MGTILLFANTEKYTRLAVTDWQEQALNNTKHLSTFFVILLDSPGCCGRCPPGQLFLLDG